MPATSRAQMLDNRIDRTAERKAFRRMLARSFFFVWCSSSMQETVLCQTSAGDIPASPWSHRTETRSANSFDSQNGADRVRQPTQRMERYPTQPSASIEPIQLADPGLRERFEPRSSNNGDTRPAPVMLMGPIVPPRSSKVSQDHPVVTTATPVPARSRNQPIDSQSDWRRVQAGGLVLESVEPSRLRGLPDRVSPLLEREPVSTQMASSKANAGENSSEPPPSISLPVHRDQPIVLGGSITPTMPVIVASPPQGSMAISSTVAENLAPSKMVPSPPVVDESQMKRIALAQRVSHERLSEPPFVPSRAPEILESPQGWQSVSDELKQRLESCDSLLKRGAVLSAREEAVQGLRRLFRTMDLNRRSSVSELAFEKAMTALKEELDFQRMVSISHGSVLESLVASHATEALKGRPLQNVQPEVASQHYRMFARYQFLIASEGHPWAADLLYALGKTLEKEGEQTPERLIVLRNQAIVCYQAATQVTPSQSEAANQLGFALIHLDRIDEAYQALSASIEHKPNPNAWNNLAEIFRRRGATSDAEYAVQQATALASGQPQYTPENPQITELDPAVFAKYSPMPTMASAAPAAYGTIPQANAQASPPSGARNAGSGSSLFSKIFR